MSSSTPLGYKLLQSLAGVAALLLASFAVMQLVGKVNSATAQGFCDDTLMTSLPSPNGHWLAEVHFSNCDISIPKRWKSYLHLTNLHSGEVFRSTVVMLGRQDDLRLEWAPESLKVSGVNLQELQRIEQPQALRVELADPVI
ncbi:hypothetical protein L9G15_09460 [Shewanella sp. A3A]|nr:hypothetical protein [Shewanella ferrihydritica]